VCVQRVVQSPWMAKCKITILNEILFDVLNNFKIVDPNQST